MDDLTQKAHDTAQAYEHERAWWDWWRDPPPADCDASYFRLRRFLNLDAPHIIIEQECSLLRRKISRMQQQRLGVAVH